MSNDQNAIPIKLTTNPSEAQAHWHLVEQDVFEGLALEKASFIALATQRVVEPHAFIFFQGDAADAAYYLARGEVRICRINPFGKESGIFTRREGELFGLAEVVGEGHNKRECNAQAQIECCYYEISKDNLDALLARSPLLAKRVMQSLGQRIRFLCEQIENLMVCDVTTRLLKLLVYLSYSKLVDPASWSAPVQVPVRLTQEQIAAMIGSCQQTVSETLAQLEKDGIIHVSRKGITVLKPAEMLNRV
ncbi:MAG: Crp/Fnr family transcriptional regulator [Chloroflexi bacterium]|nr:Crp/Fnr family transcriptional regulator [Chloroflexota bacterium]